jgi:hypothetical protein
MELRAGLIFKDRNAEFFQTFRENICNSSLVQGDAIDRRQREKKLLEIGRQDGDRCHCNYDFRSLYLGNNYFTVNLLLFQSSVKKNFLANHARAWYFNRVDNEAKRLLSVELVIFWLEVITKAEIRS